jgi:hypothetical protein
MTAASFETSAAAAPFIAAPSFRGAAIHIAMRATWKPLTEHQPCILLLAARWPAPPFLWERRTGGPRERAISGPPTVADAL